MHVYTLTANINIITRLEAARALTEIRLGERDCEEFDRLISDLKKLVPLRNKLVHDFWGETNDPNLVMVSLIKSAGKPKVQCEYMNKEYLDWLDLQLYEVSLKLIDFGTKCGLLKGYGVSAP